MANHVIYVPGLGDRNDYGQKLVIEYWRLFGLIPHYLPLGWSNPEGFEAKRSRLSKLIDDLVAHGHNVSLVGVSAGASAVLNTYVSREVIHTVVLICGKVNHPETIHDRTYDRNPDFKDSMHLLQTNLPKISQEMRSRIVSIHPWRDSLVPVPDTIIDGATEKTLPGWGHKSGIVSGVTLGGPLIARFIKREAA